MRFLICILWLLFSSLSASSQNSNHTGRPRVGVVLSGGGAKGAAHIGVLRAIEEYRIPIDYIVGTSAGAALGALYSIGYTVDQLEHIVKTADWDALMTDRSPQNTLSPVQRERNARFILNIPLSRRAKPELEGFVKGRNLNNFLTRLTLGYHDSISFDSLNIPFACVATNLLNGEEIVLRNGVLAMAMRASMSIPGVLPPVQLWGMSLVDGGLTNNFPVDVARKMGADIVIGSTVQRPLNDSLPITGLQEVIQQIVSISSRHKFKENVKDCDLCLRINTDGVSTMDFTSAAIDTMLVRGYNTSRDFDKKFQELQRLLGIVPDTLSVSHKTSAADSVSSAYTLPPYKEDELPELRSENAVFDIHEIRFDSITTAEERIIRRACNLVNYSLVSQEQIEKAVHLLGTRFLYMDANYSLNHIGDGYDLVFHARHRMASNVGVGAHFDSEELAALLLDADFILHTHVPSWVGVTARLGKQYVGEVNFTVEPMLNRQLSVYYRLSHHDLDACFKGKKAFNLEFRKHMAGVTLAYRQVKNFDWEMGMNFTCFDVTDVLFNKNNVSEDIFPKSDKYYTLFAGFKFNSQDDGYFPTKGVRASAHYEFVTDNVSRFKSPHAFSAVMASWESAVSFGDRFVFQPRISGRWLPDSKTPFVYRNAVGGVMAAKYLPQQLPFVGISNFELVRNTLLMFDMKMRYQVLKRNYVTLLAAVLAEQDKIKHMDHAKYVEGLGLQYSYDTNFGPVEALLSYSPHCRRPYFFVSVGFNF